MSKIDDMENKHAELLLNLNARHNNELYHRNMAEEETNVPFMNKDEVQAKFEQYETKISILEESVEN